MRNTLALKHLADCRVVADAQYAGEYLDGKMQISEQPAEARRRARLGWARDVYDGLWLLLNAVVAFGGWEKYRPVFERGLKVKAELCAVFRKSPPAPLREAESIHLHEPVRSVSRGSYRTMDEAHGSRLFEVKFLEQEISLRHRKG